MRYALPRLLAALAFTAGSGLLAQVNAAEHTKTLCALIFEPATRSTLYEEGDCSQRATPASTFKLALALMGYDAGILKDANTPRLPFKEGYPSWGGKNWTQATTPRRWMRYSVVWYSQQITPLLGTSTLERYARAFGYGNADFSGDAGKSNGLSRAWLTSSLLISPREQVRFLAKMQTGKLPVSQKAVQATREISATTVTAEGWQVFGKTGSAYPRKPDGRFDYAKGWGWYVGWAERRGRLVVFAQLRQDTRRHKRSGGLRSRDTFLAEFDARLR